MGTVNDQRNALVAQNIPKLVNSLTGLQSNEENFKICVNFTNSHLKHHRFLSVNSHEVKRDVSGICEKFRFSNLHDTEKKFKKLVDDCLSDSLSVNHYEKDVGFAIIQLLTSLAYDPISHLKDKIRKGQNVVPFKTISIKAPSKASETVINSLLKDNFKLPSNETDSELSEWSDSDEDSVLGSKSEESSAEDQSQQSKVSFKSSLQPPQRQSTIKTIVLEESADWLCENIEHSWWKNEVSTLAKLSSHPAANFCTLWQKHLSEKSMGFIKPQPTSLLSEKCLLREIFWMFLNPVDCKFFKMDGNEISLQANVTLPSNMPSSLHNFLKSTVRSMNIMNRLRVECQRSYSLNRQITHTIEIYYGCVQSLVLDRVSEFILEQEAIVKAQEESYTILILNKLFKPYEKMLELMWKIHETSVLDDSKYPPHICSSYLLASLYRLVLSSCSREEKNLAITIFISCLKTFMDIFEVFCTEARLDDLRSEFLMENEDVGGFDIITPRPLAKSKEKSFYLNDDIASILAADPTVNIMLNYCLKASFSFDIISKLNRVQDMRKIMNNGESLFDEFLEMIQAEIVKFTKRKITEKSEDTASSQDSNVIQDKSGIKNKKLVDDIRSGLLMNGDYVLMLSLESSLKKLENDDKPPSNEMTPEKLFDNLQEVSSYLLLPLEHSVQNILKKLLDKKVLIAESFVKDIYLKEFSIEQHLRDVRKLYFLESSELINFLYLTLFPQMESDDSSWSNPFVLTVAFNEAIGPQSDALFSVEVDNVDNLSVLGAIGKLAISYNVHKNICNIFTPNAILKYNEVFRFLLKIKWGQRVLNCLKFPEFFKNRTPYAKLQMIDLVIKRLCLTRFAMQHFIGSLLQRIMTMLQGLSHQLVKRIETCRNLSELIALHNLFVESVHKNALLGPESSTNFEIINQLLQLVDVLKKEWRNVVDFAMLDEQGNVERQTLIDLNNNSLEIEKAFGVCEYHLKLILDL